MSEDSPTQPLNKNAPSADADFVDIEDAMNVEQPRSQRTPLLLATFALLLSIIAITGVAYIALQPAAPIQQPVAPDTRALDALAAELRAIEESFSKQQQRISDLGNGDSASKGDLERLQRQLSGQLDRYASLPGRISNVENSVASIQGISAGVHDNWLLAETEYYMQIANALLQLAGNPHLARLALLQADERMQQLANPAVMNIRRALADELRALEVIQRPDIEGISLTLASLASSIDALPLKQEIDIPEAAEETLEGELSGIDRALASLRSAVSDVISVRRSDEAIRPLISPEATYFLRANMSLQLQVARLAILRGERVVFEQSLADANAWLGQYYDTASSEVVSARQTIADLENQLFDIEIPDIFESLRLLRQYRTLAAAPSENELVEAQPLLGQ